MILFLGASGAVAQTAAKKSSDAITTATTTTTGQFIVDRPTLISLGFEWKIQGDANRNAKVDLEYRKKGETTWRKGLPLLRLFHEKLGDAPAGLYGTYATDQAKGPAPNAFAGSIFNLEPDTTYEARFTLSDPDGVKGEKIHMATARTRREPQPATGQDTHSVLIDYDTFVKASMPDRKDVSHVYKSEDFDFRLKPGSKAIDAGDAIPNITDGFTGKAPDLGVYESGVEIPHYGPRP